MRKLLLASCAVLALSAGAAFTQKAFAQNTVNNSGTSTINGGSSLGAGSNISGASTLTGGAAFGTGASAADASQAANGNGSGNAFTITFPEPISGPLALGYGSHFGLGLFQPV